jgi:hypothetical protein
LEEKNKLIANSKHMTEAERAEAEARLLQAQNLALET